MEPKVFHQHGRTAYLITPDGRVLSAPIVPSAPPISAGPSAPVATVPCGFPQGPMAVTAPAGSASGKIRVLASFNGKGYRRVRIQGKNFKIHRLVATAFVPNPDNLPHVLHIDGDKTNNHYTNLQWSASQSNRT